MHNAQGKAVTELVKRTSVNLKLCLPRKRHIWRHTTCGSGNVRGDVTLSLH